MVNGVKIYETENYIVAVAEISDETCIYIYVPTPVTKPEVHELYTIYIYTCIYIYNFNNLLIFFFGGGWGEQGLW